MAGLIYPGDGTGLSFGATITAPFAVDATGITGPHAAGADLNGDGKVDLLAISGGNLLVSLATGN